MSYQLHITSTAKHDIMRAVDYMEFILKNPQAADNPIRYCHKADRNIIRISLKVPYCR